ncbi:MAG: hypothetical protein MUF48_10955 [Pirellulaceae bacterium]|nr:hypothetical protein [Pirellulaceae bacterium]
MARFTIVIATLLILLGIGSYLNAGRSAADGARPSVTALIPAFAGLPMLVLGVVALNASARKHAMHGVSVLALLAFLLPAGRLGMQLARGVEVKTAILVPLVLMSVLSAILLAACVRSFIAARRRRVGTEDVRGE